MDGVERLGTASGVLLILLVLRWVKLKVLGGTLRDVPTGFAGLDIF